MLPLQTSSEALWRAWSEPRPCRVCGKVKESVLRVSPDVTTRQDVGDHSACSLQEREWYRISSEVLDRDPEIQAADDAIYAAELARDELAKLKLTEAGIPEWMVESRIESYFYDR